MYCKHLCMMIISICVFPCYAEKTLEPCPPLQYTDLFRVHKKLNIIEKSTLTQSGEAPIVFAIHGLGDRIENFSKIHRLFPKDWRMIFVEAPIKYSRGFAWYRFRCAQRNEDLVISVNALNQLVKTYHQKYPNAPLGIFGFSQGGVMSLRSVDLDHELYQGVVSLSGYWITPSKSTANLNHSSQKKSDILVVHGTQDQVVPIHEQTVVITHFKSQGYHVKPYTFEGRHQMTSQAIQELIQFLRERLKKK